MTKPTPTHLFCLKAEGMEEKSIYPTYLSQTGPSLPNEPNNPWTAKVENAIFPPESTSWLQQEWNTWKQISQALLHVVWPTGKP